VAALTPGILIYENEAEGEVYVAVDEGVLVKTGRTCSSPCAGPLGGTDLGQLREAVEQEFLNLDERTNKACARCWRKWRAVSSAVLRFHNG
jgi:F-type H+-transporting ATPase subunit epsilon